MIRVGKNSWEPVIISKPQVTDSCFGSGRRWFKTWPEEDWVIANK